MALGCLTCKRSLDAEAYLDALTRYAPTIDTATFRCSACGGTDDVQLETGAIWIGYVAGAGTAHFCGMVKEPLAGLTVERVEDGLLVELGERTWRVPTAG